LVLEICLDAGIPGQISRGLPLNVGYQGDRLSVLAQVLDDLEAACLGREVQGRVTSGVLDVHEGLRELGQKLN
jgi:hypothetical protein